MFILIEGYDADVQISRVWEKDPREIARMMVADRGSTQHRDCKMSTTFKRIGAILKNSNGALRGTRTGISRYLKLGEDACVCREIGQFRGGRGQSAK